MMRKQEYKKCNSWLCDSSVGVRRLSLEVALLSQYPLTFEHQSPRLPERSQAYYMTTVESVNAFRAFHALLSIINTALKKLRVRHAGENDSPHPIEVALHI